MRTAGCILQRLRRSAAQVFDADQSTLVRRSLMTAFADTSNTFELLKQTIGSLTHAQPRRQTNRDRHEPGRPEHPPDRPHPENVQKNHPAHP
jgi:hypothetical protein